MFHKGQIYQKCSVNIFVFSKQNKFYFLMHYDCVTVSVLQFNFFNAVPQPAVPADEILKILYLRVHFYLF